MNDKKIKAGLCSIAAVAGMLWGVGHAKAAPRPRYSATCNSHQRELGWRARSTGLYEYAEVVRPTTGEVHVKVWVYMEFCDIGPRSYLYDPTLRFCWKNPSDHIWFTGVTFNARLDDNARGEEWNPPRIRAGNAKSRNHWCVTQTTVKPHTMRVSHFPQAHVDYTINVRDPFYDPTWWFHDPISLRPRKADWASAWH